MRQFHRVLLVTAWLSVCGAASALAYGAPAKTKNLADAKIIAALGRHAEILIDSTGGLSINDVSGPGCAGRFRPQGAAVPNLGITSAAVWVRFTVKNLTFTEDWILKAAPPGMDEVELYSGEGSDWEVLELGRKLPFSARPIPNANLLFPLNLPLGKEATFYLRYANGMGMTLPLRLYSAFGYQSRALGEQLAFGIFFGFMLVLSLYNLILYAKVRDRGYLYCFLYSAAYGLFEFGLYGLAYQYLWPSSPGWAGHSAPYFLAFAIFCRILFTMSVLDSKTCAPSHHKALQGMLAALPAMAAYQGCADLRLLPPGWTLAPGAALGCAALYFAALTLTVLGLNVRALRRRVPAARTFLPAWIFLAAGSGLCALKSAALLPSGFLTEYAPLIGSVGEMCLLLAGLGESIRAIRTEARERRLRQQEAVRALQETRIRAMRLELELLKANIQPHFMLNSINSAIMWIGENPPAAVKLLHSLSLELKQLLKIVAAKVIPIGEEIRICRLHLEVMSLRHDKRFALRVEGVEAGDRIPPLVVHTLIENGLTHGFAGKDEGSFVLSRSQAADGIRFTLFNDGAAGNDGADSGGLGLRYVRARLEEAYGRNWRLDSRPVDGGWLVTIFIGSNAFGKPADAHGSFPEGVPGLPSAGGPGPEAYRGKGATAFPPRPAPEPVR